jgi:putative ABC transport system substrate-binding protein
VKRREFIAGLGSAAAWPLIVGAQPQTRTPPVVGFLHTGSPERNVQLVAAFQKGLNESGYVDGQNVAVEFHWARDSNARLGELAADLVHRRVAVIFAWSGLGALAAKAATTDIPIVFSTGGDAVQIGLVASLNRPGGNITGIASMDVELTGKRLELLHALVPNASRIAGLIDPAIPDFEPMIAGVKAGARATDWNVEFLQVRSGEDIDAAFAGLAQKRSDALLVIPSALFVNNRIQIVSLAARHSLPAMYSDRNYPEVGGLAGYGPSNPDQVRKAGIYTGRILKGEKAADLPVMRPTKFDFVINLKTARALGLTIPETLLATADEVIQ